MGRRAAIIVPLYGEQFRWELELLGFAHPGAGGVDAEWIDAQVELGVREDGHDLTERVTTYVATVELRGFERELATLLSTTAGRAAFAPIEGETGLTLTADASAGEGYRADTFLQSVSESRFDATDLRASPEAVRSLLDALRDATALFPVQDRPEEDA